MRFITVAFLAFALTACAKSPPVKAPNLEQDATVALAESADSVNNSLITLNAVNQAANPPKDISTPPDPATYGMAIPASLDWSGPAAQAVNEVANATGYKFKTLGTPPSMPMLVSVHEQNTTLGDILRDIGLQCKDYAQIVIYPKSKTIELRYIERS